jgi:protein ImuB
MKRFTLQTESDLRRRRKNNRPPSLRARQCLGFRRFRPPLRAIVEAHQGWPTQISAWSKQRSVYGKVVDVAGPWRSTGDWWRDDGWARDEWDVTLERLGRQTLYRVYREINSENWFVEGNYD